MVKKTNIRAYQNKEIEDNVYQFEMGNELGAQLEVAKKQHELRYTKKALDEHQVKKKENE